MKVCIHGESSNVESFIAWDLLQSLPTLYFIVKMSACQSKTRLLIFAYLQDKSPHRNFTLKSSNTQTKPFAPCRPARSLQSAMCKSCRARKAKFRPARCTVPKLLQAQAATLRASTRAVCCFPNCSWRATRLRGDHGKDSIKATKS